jgi:serine-type D-Ala-D-Ala carboxypeptidase/endopeptidase (penicillin-binding protein 4)
MEAARMTGLRRRDLLAGLMAGAAWPALAEAPLGSPVPPARPERSAGATPSADLAEAIIAEAKLPGAAVSYLLMDAKSGDVLASREPDRPMPPASTLKAITSLYALGTLGAGHRFATRILVTGPVRAGRVEGDLILAGGGDPALSTDDLGDLAAAVRAAGVLSVAGRFLVWGGALPYLPEIDRAQPEWLGYNPAVSGLNLNFNRVNFTWARGGDGYRVGFDARAERFAPAVEMARMKVVARDLPIFTYADGGRTEDWTVAQAALNKDGSRWLPVRRPDLYAGDVFHTLMTAQGVKLDRPEVLASLPPGATVLRGHESAPLPEVLRDMLKFSTNMTAETVGMAASMVRGAKSHAASARAMAAWLAAGIGRQGAHFVDHSGLGGASRVSAVEMAEALRLLGPGAGLGGLMKPVKFKDAKDLGSVRAPQRVAAKTGTLNFVSGLVGYMTTAAGQARVFAIYAADVARRDAVPPGDRENPPGASSWAKRARRMELRLIGSWA